MVSGLVRDGKMSINAMYNELAFKKKSSRIDWRKIAAVDLDRIARDMDVYTLQENIDHITFCNIDSEIDTRMMDPNFVKLFKISQFIIEYLIHSQNYLTDVIGSIEGQFNGTTVERDELKKTNEKLQKDLTEAKKENKRRKKMIETQQTLMSVTSANYHQCAYCSKVFLNISYLQAHMARRHPELNATPANPKITEMDKELAVIKERLRTTENELLTERNARLGSAHSAATQPSSVELTLLLQKQIEEKSNEVKKIKEEMKRSKMTLNNEIHELSEKNGKLEKSIKELQERLGKESHVGWIKDDIDLEKDTVIKLKNENDILNQTIENNKKQLAELKEKYKARETAIREKHSKEINEKIEEIERLKARLTELQSSIGKNESELATRIQQLLAELHEEQQKNQQLEQELADWRKRPPVVTPRKPAPSDTPRSPSPPKLMQPPPYTNHPIYLTEYCPLTLQAVQENPNLLANFRRLAEQMLQDELDDIGIDKNVKGLSKLDFKSALKRVKEIRQERADDMEAFYEQRREFADMSARYANDKILMTTPAAAAVGSRSMPGNRVTFKNEDKSSVNRQPPYPQVINQQQQQQIFAQRQTQQQRTSNHLNSSLTQQSEETDNDVSLESIEDITEKSQSNHQNYQSQQRGVSGPKKANSPRKGPRVSGSMNPNVDDNSDFESISQLMSDRSAKKKDRANNVNVNDTKRKLEKQFEQNAKRTNKPTPNAVSVGFQPQTRNQKHDDSLLSDLSDIENIENELKAAQRPKSGLRSSLHDSQSSSVWVSDSNDTNGPVPAANHNNNNQANPERPATANSSKTLNFDSDDIENIE